MKQNDKNQYVVNGRSNVVSAPRRRRVTEPVVKSGLSYTPAQMAKLSEQGIPVSMGNAANFNDGVENPEWDVAPDMQRGVDPADLWEAEQMVKEKMYRGYRGFVKKQKSKQQNGEE